MAYAPHPVLTLTPASHPDLSSAPLSVAQRLPLLCGAPRHQCAEGRRALPSARRAWPVETGATFGGAQNRSRGHHSRPASRRRSPSRDEQARICSMLLVGGLLLLILVASLPLLIPLAIGALSASTVALPTIAIAVGTPRQSLHKARSVTPRRLCTQELRWSAPSSHVRPFSPPSFA